MSENKFNTSMELTDEQVAVCNGAQGDDIAKCMQTLIRYGEAFGARRLIPIKSAHLAGSFKITSFKSYYEIVEKLASNGVKFSVPTTANPRTGIDFSLPNRIVFSGQDKHEENLEKMGVIPNYSCVCYHDVNKPEFGDVLGWAESSAIIYANSVIGARSNRNSVMVDICQAVTGLTPEFGYLLTENRKGQIKVNLEIDVMDAAALGFILGEYCIDKIPVLDYYPFSKTELKNMGGAMAAAGGVTMFHVVGLTPEATTEDSAFQGQEPEDIITITQTDLTRIRAEKKLQQECKIVAFGCPQMTLKEATDIGEHFVGKKVKKRTMFHMIPDHLKEFEKTDLYEDIVKSGVEFYNHCPVAALTVRVGIGKQQVLTTSGKMYYYLEGTQYSNLNDVLKVCGVI